MLENNKYPVIRLFEPTYIKLLLLHSIAPYIMQVSDDNFKIRVLISQ